MAEEEKKKTEETSNPDLVDENGVPWKNRAKEYERKLREQEERLSALESKSAVSAPEKDEEEPVDSESLVKEFVKNPLAFIRSVSEDVLSERERAQEQKQAVNWIESQRDYDEKDAPRIVEIVREFDLGGLPPMQRAATTMKILRKEKAMAEESKKLQTGASNRTRELAEEGTEGPGRRSPGEKPQSRASILDMLSKTNNPREQARLVGLYREAKE